MNKFIFHGELISEIKALKGGVVRFRLKVKSNDGKDNSETTNYFSFVAFDMLAKEILEKFKLGDFVKVAGFIKNTKYEKNGNTIYDYDFVIKEVM